MRLIIIFVLTISMLACGKKVKEKESIRPVFYLKLSDYASGGARSFSGLTQAENEAKLSFKVGGTLEDVHFKLGEKVKAGAVIAHLNSEDYQVNYQKALSSLDNAKIQVSNAKSSFERIEKLYASQSASLSDFENVKAQYESSKTLLKTSMSQVRAAKNQLKYTKIIAPFDGSISKVMAKEKEIAGVGMPIVMFLSDGNVKINSQVPENAIRQIKVGQEVRITFTSIADKTYQGVVSEIGYSTGTASTYPLIIDLSEKYEEILPGMACSITVVFDQEESVERLLLIPHDAVAHDEGGDFVFVLATSETPEFFIATRRNVVLGDLTPAGYEIIEGLSADEMIVTAGLSFMYDGRKVRLLE